MGRDLIHVYLASVLRLPTGCNSASWFWSLISKSHSSSFVSLEKSASTAPARVPVARERLEIFEDQAKAAVLGTSLTRPILSISVRELVRIVASEEEGAVRTRCAKSGEVGEADMDSVHPFSRSYKGCGEFAISDLCSGHVGRAAF